MFKIILPIAGGLIHYYMYRIFPYKGELSLLILIGIPINVTAGFVFGYIIDRTKKAKTKNLLIVISLLGMLAMSWVIFPYKNGTLS